MFFFNLLTNNKVFLLFIDSDQNSAEAAGVRPVRCGVRGGGSRVQEAADEEEEGEQQAGEPRHTQGGAQAKAADALSAGLHLCCVQIS